jgi:cold shock protein
MERQIGTVKWFSRTKGYGFLVQSSGPDVFVHYSAIKGEGFRNLDEGQQVEFTVQQGPKGLQAVDVALLSTNDQPTRDQYQSNETHVKLIPQKTRSPKPPVARASTTPSAPKSTQPGISMKGVRTSRPYQTGEFGNIMTDLERQELQAASARIVVPPSLGKSTSPKSKQVISRPVAKICPQCKKSFTNLKKHIAKKHPKSRKGSQTTSQNRSLDSEKMLQSNDESRDGGKYLGFISREDGKFGSLPLYDDYGDESNAE